MSNLPPLVIILLTYQRTEYALMTVKALKHNLWYGGQVVIGIMDDGSDASHFKAVHDTCRDSFPIAFSQSKRVGYGAMANAGWLHAANISPVTLWMEDDWELRRPLDITPYVNLLQEREDVGMARLGHMPIGLNLRSLGHNGRMYLEVKKDEQYAFSGNPHLKHQRTWAAWGAYPINQNPGQTEISYDWQVRSQPGPAIWWALAIGDDPLFGHIGEVQSYEI